MAHPVTNPTICYQTGKELKAARRLFDQAEIIFDSEGPVSGYEETPYVQYGPIYRYFGFDGIEEFINLWKTNKLPPREWVYLKK